MTAWKTDLIPVTSDQQSYYEVLYPANINSMPASSHKEELSMLIPNRLRSNVVSTSPHGSPRRIRCCSEKRVSLPSICQYRSDIDQTSGPSDGDVSPILSQRLPASAVIPTMIRLLQHCPTHSRAPEFTSLLRRFQGPIRMPCSS